MLQNYHLQLPPPYNTIILGGGKAVVAHDPRSFIHNDSEDKQFDGLPEFYKSWPASDVAKWPGKNPAELSKKLDDGGVWTGSESHLPPHTSVKSANNSPVYSSSIDEFPFVGAVPNHNG